MRRIHAVLAATLIVYPMTARADKVSVLKKKWINADRPVSISPRVRVAIDRAKKLSRLIEEAGYDSYEVDIPDGKPKGEDVRPKIVCRLVHFRAELPFSDKLDILDALRLRAATAEELMSFSIAYPEERMKFVLIALGSRWVNASEKKYVAALGYLPEPHDNRWIGLVPEDDLWTDEIDGTTIVVAVEKDE